MNRRGSDEDVHLPAVEIRQSDHAETVIREVGDHAVEALLTDPIL